MSNIGDEILREKEASFEANQTKRLLYDELERIFHGQLNDNISADTQSQVFDPILSTLLIERAYRVMAQLATGKVKGIDKNDLGDAKLKNLILEKYVIPNANAQFGLLTKFRMVDMYSGVYGSFDVLVDQDIKPNGYIGPDMWLLPKRDVFDQVGAVSLEDAGQVIVRTWQPIPFFEKLRGKPGYKNIDKIITKLKSKSGSKQDRDSNNTSKREEDQYPNSQPLKKKGFFEVLTRFERDRWVDICVDADNEVFRDQKNPHDDDELPVIRKYAMPLLDDPQGMGDIERGMGMQMAVNSNWNLMFDGIKMSTQPPVIINKDNVASPSSFKPIPGAQWLGRGNVDNVARPINLNPQGIATFNNTHQVANAAILKLFGTTDTAVTAQTDPGLGKTPQALEMQQQRMNTRDSADRFYMEQFVTKVMRKMVNLISKKQQGAISFRMFPDEVEQLAREYPEIKNQYDETTGKLTVKNSSKSSLYDYEIVTGSTYAIDQESQQKNLQMFLQMYLQAQGPQGNSLDTLLRSQGYNFKFGELFKRVIANSGIQDWDNILEEMTSQELGDHFMNNDHQQFLSGLSNQNLNQIPPQPSEQMAAQGAPLGVGGQAQIGG